MAKAGSVMRLSGMMALFLMPVMAQGGEQDACLQMQKKMDSMMEMMKSHHEMMTNKWVVAGDAIYTLIQGRLQKVSPSLQASRDVALDELVPTPDSGMAAAGLMPDLKVSDGAVFVVWHGYLLKFDAELSLLAKTKL